MNKFSLIIPAFNEAGSIKNTLANLQSALAGLEYEIIVIDDCSTDQTAEILKNISGIKVITQPYNKGYGAALKIGARAAQFDWLLTFDADGQQIGRAHV
jgi:glycosyltransferase involved in cell wall biosynthesis